MTIERAGEGALTPERRDTLTRAYESFDPRWIEEMLRRHEYVLACDRFFTRLKGNPNFAQRPESGYRCQRALNRDPGFSPNRDPLVTGANGSGRPGGAGSGCAAGASAGQ